MASAGGGFPGYQCQPRKPSEKKRRMPRCNAAALLLWQLSGVSSFAISGVRSDSDLGEVSLPWKSCKVDRTARWGKSRSTGY